MTAEEYLNEHGITQASVDKFELEDRGDKLAIPVKDKNGGTLFYKYRNLNYSEDSEAPKYLFDKGSKAQIFNPQALEKPNIVICEGEIDCIRLDQEGIPAVTGTAGASTFPNSWLELFTGKTCLICYDTDEPGKENALKVAQKLASKGINARIVNLPEDCKDICEFFASGHSQDEFLDAYTHNISSQNDEAIEASPVGIALTAFMEDKSFWEGTASELLSLLDKLTDKLKIDTRFHGWPKSASMLSRKAQLIHANLAERGINVIRDDKANQRATGFNTRRGARVQKTCTGGLWPEFNRRGSQRPRFKVDYAF